MSYKAPSTLNSLYNGFKLYYESKNHVLFYDILFNFFFLGVERSTQSNCPTNIPFEPTAPTTVTTLAPFIINLAASNLLKNYICKGNELIIDIPPIFLLFPISYYYGTTPDLTCNTIGYAKANIF